jgi:hypothetical protein
MEPTVKLEVNVQMLNTILTGLAKLPLEQSMETFHAVRQQADNQLNQEQLPEGPLGKKVVK